MKSDGTMDQEVGGLCLGSCGLQKQVGLGDFTKKAEETQHLVEQCLIQTKLFLMLSSFSVSPLFSTFLPSS